jgi:putative transposase
MFVMPRGPRLDAPGVLHHVMTRGLARRAIFRDDQDRADFVRRLATLAGAGGVACVCVGDNIESLSSAGAHGVAASGAHHLTPIG